MKPWMRRAINAAIVVAGILFGASLLSRVFQPSEIPPSAQTGTPVDAVPEWFRWLSIVMLAGSYATAAGLMVTFNRRVDREMEIVVQELRVTPPKVITKGSEAPPEVLGNLLASLRKAGFRHLGRCEIRYSLRGVFTGWVMVNRTGAVRAIVMMPEQARIPTLLLTTQFTDDALLETRMPRSNAGTIRRPGYYATSHTSLDRALAYHDKALSRFEEVHGLALTVATLDEHLKLGMRTLDHNTVFLKAARKGRYDVLAYLGVFVLPLLYFLIVTSAVSAICPSFAVLMSVFLAGFAFLLRWEYQRIPL